MKTKEELLRVFSAYLPYGLKIVSHLGTTYQLNTFRDMKGSGIENLDIESVLNGKYKPVLYPLEYLTKPIEHEGKTITPIVELSKIVSFYEIEHIEGYSTSGYDSVIYFQDSKGFYRGLDIVISPEGYLQFSFYTRNGSFASDFNHLRIDHIRVTNKLLEWHFNVFNLPEDQFINKATLKQ